MEDSLITILIILTVVSPLVFLVGLIMCIVSKEEANRKLGIKLLIFSLISFLIGIGGCLMIINSTGMH
jgi:hypothetical protein